MAERASHDLEEGHRVHLRGGVHLIFLHWIEGGACFALQFGSGEVREQNVLGLLNFHARWEETVKRRAEKLEDEELTPFALIPRRKK